MQNVNKQHTAKKSHNKKILRLENLGVTWMWILSPGAAETIIKNKLLEQYNNFIHQQVILLQ